MATIKEEILDLQEKEQSAMPAAGALAAAPAAAKSVPAAACGVMRPLALGTKLQLDKNV